MTQATMRAALPSALIYLGSAGFGFMMTFWGLTNPPQGDVLAWVWENLGFSVWAFSGCTLAFAITLSKLGNELAGESDYRRVSQLDQLSDVWVSLIVGIGVIWTAIGMRSALVTTLGAPDHFGGDAGHVLERLVNGGILLALSTTIVGAIGGYILRLIKTLTLGHVIADFYWRYDRQGLDAAIERLNLIESHLRILAASSDEFHDEG